jgi:hypothetical protein
VLFPVFDTPAIATRSSAAVIGLPRHLKCVWNGGDMGYAFCAFGGLFSRGLEAHKAKAKQKQGKGKGQSDTRCDARCA